MAEEIILFVEGHMYTTEIDRLWPAPLASEVFD